MTALYDALNGWGPDYDYWLGLVARLEPEAIVDLGCGTGQLTVLFARQGAAAVLGVDPDPLMLSVAQQRDGHDLVTWLAGYAGDLPAASHDLVTMTSHVAQVFLSDVDWLAALRDVRRALRPGGHVMFDMRNLLAQGWEQWDPVTSRRQVDGDDGPVEVWHEVTSVRDGLVAFDTTTRHVATGRQTRDTDVLRFRSEVELRDSLLATGFRVVHVHGDWDGSPATPQSRELIVLADVATRYH